MTVHARGYRTYQGTFGGTRPVFTIAGEGFRIALKQKAFKRIGILYLMWFSMCMFFLYLMFGTHIGKFMDAVEKGLEGVEGAPQDLALVALNGVLLYFYKIVGYLTALLAIFVGAGLIAEDLDTGALPLYVVRPIRPWQYVVGKALVLPGILLVALVLPGLLFYLIVGLWQPPGESWAFLSGHLDVVVAIFEHYVLAAAAYTGLMLFLSSRSPRRAAVAVMGAVTIFGGVLLGQLAQGGVVEGKLASIFLLGDLPKNAITPFLWRIRSATKPVEWEQLASHPAILGIALAVLVLGLLATWWRVRSVEVTA